MADQEATERPYFEPQSPCGPPCPRFAAFGTCSAESCIFFHASLPLEPRRWRYCIGCGSGLAVPNFVPKPYTLLRRTIEANAFTLDQEHPEECDMFWGQSFPGLNFLRKLKPSTKLNHFPRIDTISHKNELAQALCAFQGSKAGPDVFHPKSYILPAAVNEFLAAEGGSERTVLWIAKPYKLGCSRGHRILPIGELRQLSTDPEEVKKSRKLDDASLLLQPRVMQLYVADPLLVDGRKLNMRAYVCVRSFSPVEAYVYHAPLFGISPRLFTTDRSSLEDPRVHLQPMRLHCSNDDFWDIDRMQAWACEKGYDFRNDVWRERIHPIVRRVCEAAAPVVNAATSRVALQLGESRDLQCCQLLALDFIFAADGFWPWLMEANHYPDVESSLLCHNSAISSVQHPIKSAMLADYLSVLMGNHSPIGLGRWQRV
eukprot:TRINITY_DN11196_c0_g1_i1.p1 TRINITY_DN11196_c0_g1~~TRINITY_DN11196_c0_g1_i1.p1  ORF type:complete len:436 (+),score=36.18 TRINITY_DN11196_c0_g1_i1:22-1308(+)